MLASWPTIDVGESINKFTNEDSITQLNNRLSNDPKTQSLQKAKDKLSQPLFNTHSNS